MKFAKIKATAALLALPYVTSTSIPENYGEPYRILQEANRKLDPALAASAYASGAVLILEIPGQPTQIFRGRQEIEKSYAQNFSQVEPGSRIELEFRFAPPGPNRNPHSGLYCVKARVRGKDFVTYGKFTVKLVNEQGVFRFAEDRGTVASAKEFDALPPFDL